MKITEDMVDYISQLSRLQLPAEEKTAMTAELERIVAYMDVLNSLDTTDVEPLSHIFPLKNVLRSDEVVPSYDRETLLALDATVVLYRGGEVPLEAFMASPIAFNDILLKVRIRDDGRRAAYQSVRRSTTDFPTLAAAVSCLNGQWTVSVGARPARAVRCESAAACLNEGKGAAAAGQAAAGELTYGTDLRAGADYRKKLAAVLVRRAAEQCMEENKG